MLNIIVIGRAQKYQSKYKVPIEGNHLANVQIMV